MPETWEPLFVRDGDATEYRALHDGIPGWLMATVEHELRDALSFDLAYRREYRPERLGKVERKLRTDLGSGGASHRYYQLIGNLREDQQLALQVVDLALAEGWITPDRAEALDESLEEGGSAWRVASSRYPDKEACLERRVEASAHRAAQVAMSIEDNASQHLKRAWDKAFGVHPDPSGSHAESIRAVEAVAHTIVTPDDDRATLGKMISAMRDKPAGWHIVLEPTTGDPVRHVVAMMELLWTSQAARHGSAKTEKIESSQAEAEASVHLAVTLVQLFRSGAVQRVSPK